jgi:hypothetical protein
MDKNLARSIPLLPPGKQKSTRGARWVSFCVRAEKTEAREARKIEPSAREAKKSLGADHVGRGKPPGNKSPKGSLSANNELKTQRLVERADDRVNGLKEVGLLGLRQRKDHGFG